MYADQHCTYTEALNPHRYIFTGPCYYSGLPYTVEVLAEELYAYRQGALAQDAFKSLNSDEREFLISGCSPAGWFSIFPPEQPELIILQGPPGSGKSGVARKLANKIINAVIVSTDERHFNDDGKYEFKKDQVARFHQQTQQKAQVLMSLGCTVIVDNTNILNAHVKPYVMAAEKYGFKVRFIRVDGNYPNTHGVPDDIVQKMRSMMEDLSVEKALASEGIGGKRA